MNKNYWVIEHPSYGVLTEWDWNGLYPVPKFRWSILRSEGKKFYSRRIAERELQAVQTSSKRGVKKAYIYEMGT